METTKFQKRIKLGTVDNAPIFLSAPSWDCGWYWGFGYLGNKDCHYHVDGLQKGVNLFDGFKNHFGESFILKNDSDIWELAELFATFYTLKEAAEVYERGGSHYTSNPIKGLIVNHAEVDRINNEIMPALFDCIYDLLTKNV